MKKNQRQGTKKPTLSVVNAWLRSLADTLSLSHLVFPILAIPVILLFALNTPPGWGLDEQVHAARAYQIADGGLYPDRLNDEGGYGGALPSSLVNTLRYGHAVSNAIDRGDVTFQRKDITDPGLTGSLLAQPINDDSKTVYDFGPTGPYAPFVYTGSAIGFFIGSHIDASVGTSVFLAKIVQAALYVGIVYFSLYVLRHYRARWLIFVVALLPSSLYQAASINADSITIAASLLFFAVSFRAFIQKPPLSKRLLMLLCFAVIGIALSKPSYAFLLLVLLLIPRKSFESVRARYFIKYGLLMIGAALIGVFLLIGMKYSNSILMYREASVAANISLSGQLIWILNHPLQFAEIFFQSVIMNSREWQTSLVGVLGYNTVPVYHIFQVALLSLLLILAMTTERIRGYAAGGYAVAGVLSSVAVIGVLYATFNEVGSNYIIGVQGRYFIPCIVFALAIVPFILPFELSNIRPRLLNLGSVAVCAICLISVSITYLKFLY